MADPLSDPDAKGGPQAGSIAVRSGAEIIDQLMTRMLKPDPRDRPTPTQLLQHPAFQLKGVGCPEAHALIVALKTGDPARIEQAHAALRQVLR